MQAYSVNGICKVIAIRQTGSNGLHRHDYKCSNEYIPSANRGATFVFKPFFHIELIVMSRMSKGLSTLKYCNPIQIGSGPFLLNRTECALVMSTLQKLLVRNNFVAPPTKLKSGIFH